MKYVYVCPNHKEIIYVIDEAGYTRHCKKCHEIMYQTDVNEDDFYHENFYDQGKYRNKRIEIIHDYLQCEKLDNVNKQQTDKQIAISKFANYVLKYKILKERTSENRCPMCGSLKEYKLIENLYGTIIKNDKRLKQKNYYECYNCGFTTRVKLFPQNNINNGKKESSFTFNFLFSTFVFFILWISAYSAIPSAFISFIITCISMHFFNKATKKIL